MVQATSDENDATVTWELYVTDSPILQTLAYIGPSIFGGIAILAGGLLLWLVVSALLDGNFAQAVGFVGFAVLALFARRYLPAVLATDAFEPLWTRYSRRGLIVGSVGGALVVLTSAQLHPMAPFAVFIASWVPVILTAGFPTSGRVDRTRSTLVVDETEVPLGAVSGFRTLSMGAFTVCWLSYTRGVPTAPRLITLPSNSVDVVSALIETPPDTSKRERSSIDRTERLLFVLFGLGMVALGPILWVILPPGDGQVVALYAGAMFGLFGAMLLWYAYNA